MSEDNMSELIANFKNMLHNSNETNSNNNSNMSSATNSSFKNNVADANNSGSNASPTGYESNNLNISPEMINNIANMLKNSNFSSGNLGSANQNTASGSNENVASYSSSNAHNNKTTSNGEPRYNTYSNNGTNNNKDNGSNNTNPSIDFETIMKIKSMMDTFNQKDDPRSNLLYSLKPYLRKTRQNKLDQYVNLLKITQVADIFNFKKGDKK